MKRLALITAVCLFVPLYAAPVGAQECATDTDCPKNYTCETEVYAAPCAAEPCRDGESCAEPEPCTSTTEEYSYCMPNTCTADSQCAEGMKCKTFELSGGCSVAPCSSEEPDCQSEPICEPSVTESYCVPAYIGPCQANADCGAGFECVPAQDCWCSGSGGSIEPDIDGGSADPAPSGEGGSSGFAAPEEQCGCEPTGTNYCELIVTPCETAATCPSGFTCEASYYADSDCAVSSDGQTDCPEPTEPQKICLPPYSDLFGSRGGADYEAGLDTGASGVPTNDATKSGSSDESAAAASSESGCSLANGSTRGGALGAGLLALLGLALLRRRRAC
jgi:MYXO-CTERM domain-containing protein